MGIVFLARKSVFYTTTKWLFYTFLRLEKEEKLCYITVRKGDTNVQVKPKVPKKTGTVSDDDFEGNQIPA